MRRFEKDFVMRLPTLFPWPCSELVLSAESFSPIHHFPYTFRSAILPSHRLGPSSVLVLRESAQRPRTHGNISFQICEPRPMHGHIVFLVPESFPPIRTLTWGFDSRRGRAPAKPCHEYYLLFEPPFIVESRRCYGVEHGDTA